jgi:hypothetical protein
MNVEGAEDLILMGAKKTLRIIKSISIDCGKEKLGRGNYGKCLKILKNYKFKILKIRKIWSYVVWNSLIFKNSLAESFNYLVYCLLYSSL